MPGQGFFTTVGFVVIVGGGISAVLIGMFLLWQWLEERYAEFVTMKNILADQIDEAQRAHDAERGIYPVECHPDCKICANNLH